MPRKNSETGAKKSVTKPPKRKKDTEASQTIGTENRHEMIATAAYYLAEKRDFRGNDADAVQDWLEAEVGKV